MSKHIGFIGLGNMGRGMCRNLIRAGHTLTVFDTSEAAAEAFRGQAEIAGSVAQVGQNSDVLFLSLPNSNIVESVVAQLLETGLEGKILLDTSTSYPLSTQKLAQQVKEAGGFMLDAPMLAGPEEAESGDLLAVVGGEEEIYQQVVHGPQRKRAPDEAGGKLLLPLSGGDVCPGLPGDEAFRPG